MLPRKHAIKAQTLRSYLQEFWFKDPGVDIFRIFSEDSAAQANLGTTGTDDFYIPSNPRGFSKERHCLHSDRVWALKLKTPDLNLSWATLHVNFFILLWGLNELQWLKTTKQKQNTPRLAQGISRFSINAGLFLGVVMTRSHQEQSSFLPYHLPLKS